MQKNKFVAFVFMAFLFSCALHGMQWFQKLNTKNRIQKVQPTVRKPASKLTRRVESFMTGKEYTPRASTQTYAGRQILPKKNIFARTFEYFKSGKSFEQQEQLRNRINSTLLSSIIEKDWAFNPKTTPQFLANAQEYLDKPLFNGKTLLEQAFADYLHVAEVSEIIRSKNSPQDIADTLYQLFFPRYRSEYGQREILNQKRRDILAYIDALLKLNASIGKKKEQNIRNLLLTKHSVELFLKASANPSHHSTSTKQLAQGESIQEFFKPITEKLEQLAQQEKLDWEKLNLEAYTQAQKNVATCGVCKKPTPSSPVEDL